MAEATATATGTRVTDMVHHTVLSPNAVWVRRPKNSRKQATPMRSPDGMIGGGDDGENVSPSNRGVGRVTKAASRGSTKKKGASKRKNSPATAPKEHTQKRKRVESEEGGSEPSTSQRERKRMTSTPRPGVTPQGSYDPLTITKDLDLGTFTKVVDLPTRTFEPTARPAVPSQLGGGVFAAMALLDLAMAKPSVRDPVPMGHPPAFVRADTAPASPSAVDKASRLSQSSQPISEVVMLDMPIKWWYPEEEILMPLVVPTGPRSARAKRSRVELPVPVAMAVAPASKKATKKATKPKPKTAKRARGSPSVCAAAPEVAQCTRTPGCTKHTGHQGFCVGHTHNSKKSREAREASRKARR